MKIPAIFYKFGPVHEMYKITVMDGFMPISLTKLLLGQQKIYCFSTHKVNLSLFVNSKEDYLVYALKLGAEIGGYASLLLGVSIYHLVKIMDLILRWTRKVSVSED